MMKLTVTIPDGQPVIQEYDHPVTPLQIAESMRSDLKYAITACRINNRSERLNTPIEEDCTVDLLDMRNAYGNMAYQISLTLLYIKAVHDVLGKDVRVRIANSLCKGLYTVIRKGNITDLDAEMIQARMEELVQEDLPIEEQELTFAEARRLLKDGPEDEKRLFESTEIPKAYLCTLEDEANFFYVHLLPSTRLLTLFEVRRYRNGVLLRFPHPMDPSRVPEYVDQKHMYEAFSEETHWEKLMGISYACDLNNAVRNNEYKDLIMLSEALHEKKVAAIAHQIHSEGKRIILIAGPSSSGKTSFAQRLCIQLRVLGLKPLYLGTDDYFVNRADMIPDENGNLDYEGLSAVDVPLFTQQMNDLLAGKQVDIPSFDFVDGVKIFGKRIVTVDETQPIVIEGIHGLNPKLTEGIPDEDKFRIYISPLTQINIDEHSRIPTTDARMLRRLVRDNRTRGRSASRTLTDWPNVRKGEEIWIFPYSSEADTFFNSHHIYELPVLKKYAEPLLEQITPDDPTYSEAQRMLTLLGFFETIEDDSVIANNSLLREFIGGSVIV